MNSSIAGPEIHGMAGKSPQSVEIGYALHSQVASHQLNRRDHKLLKYGCNKIFTHSFPAANMHSGNAEGKKIRGHIFQTKIPFPF
jgi:hypothetical protein